MMRSLMQENKPSAQEMESLKSNACESHRNTMIARSITRRLMTTELLERLMEDDKGSTTESSFQRNMLRTKFLDKVLKKLGPGIEESTKWLLGALAKKSERLYEEVAREREFTTTKPRRWMPIVRQRCGKLPT
jgi:phosphoribosyl-ATP pyrophosphohydrolase